MIDFYTVILRKSADYWVSLCLENGLVGQGNTPEQSIDKLKQAIQSFSIQQVANRERQPVIPQFLAVQLQSLILIETLTGLGWF